MRKKIILFILVFTLFFTNLEKTNALLNLKKQPVTNEEVVNYFNDAVFVGDSVMLGFKYYQDIYHNLGKPTFLSTVSFALRYAVNPNNSYFYPLYNGQKIPVEDALTLLKAKKVFISLGINDVAITGVPQAVLNYETFINQIRKKNPDIEIYLMSTTYIVNGGERGYLNNVSLSSLDREIKNKAQDWNVEYIDVMSLLKDSNGYLSPYYSIDYYVHLSNSAYDIWVRILKDFVKDKLMEERIYSFVDDITYFAQKISNFVY